MHKIMSITTIVVILFVSTLPVYGEDGYNLTIGLLFDKIKQLKYAMKKICFEGPVDPQEDPYGRQVWLQIKRQIYKSIHLFPAFEPEDEFLAYGASRQFPGSNFNCINHTGLIKLGINEYYFTNGELTRWTEFQDAVRFDVFFENQLANVIVSDNNRQSMSIIVNFGTNDVYINDINLNVATTEQKQAEQLALEEINKVKRGIKLSGTISRNALVDVTNNIYHRLAIEKNVTAFDFATTLLLDNDIRIRLYSLALLYSEQR